MVVVSVSPMSERLNAAVEWIQRAHVMAGDGGISKGYDLLRRRWAPSYPETTGYTIPSLFNAAEATGRSDLRELALLLADHLVMRVGRERGVIHWSNSGAGPIVFDTAQVMFGWLAAWNMTGRSDYLQAAVRAGDWLTAVQDESGSWRRHQYLNVEKVIDTRAAWALLLLYAQTGDSRYQRAAVRNLQWARRQQDPDGWFRRCAFVEGEDPYTHTLAYTAEGLFECGLLLDDALSVEAARLTVDALLERQRPDGSLASTYGPSWRETSRSSCLTGNCQMASLWLRFERARGGGQYRSAALKAIDFVASTQKLSTGNENVRGGIAGSSPVYGRYERFKYPNWAAKFFIDALLDVNRRDGADGARHQAG